MFEQIVQNLYNLDNPKTKDVRRLGKSYKKQMNNLPLDDLFTLVESLLQVQEFQTTTLAYQLLNDQASRLERKHFSNLNHFVITYIQDWWDCDDLFTHAFAMYFLNYPEELENIKAWTTHERFAVRRSAAVALIVPARQQLIPFHMIEDICNILHTDEHYLVLKGYGWLLKEATKHYHDDVVQYVTSHVATMPRTAFRYALEKLPIEERQQLMKL